MADGQQLEEHWTENGQENGQNGYSVYSHRENGYHGGASAHPGSTVDDSANLPPSPPPSPSAEQTGSMAQAQLEGSVTKAPEDHVSSQCEKVPDAEMARLTSEHGTPSLDTTLHDTADTTSCQMHLDSHGKESLLTEDLKELMAEDKGGSTLPKENREVTEAGIGITHQEITETNAQEQGERNLSSLEPQTFELLSGSKNYFETSSESHDKESLQSSSYYEISTTANASLQEKAVSQGDKKTDILCSERLLQPTSDSLDVIPRSSVGTTFGEQSKVFPETLCPIEKGFNCPSVSSLESNTPIVHSPTTRPSVKHVPSGADGPSAVDFIMSTSEKTACSTDVLDLAGPLTSLSKEKRECHPIRRKSVPADLPTLPKEVQLEQQDYCVLTECSAPLSSPADVPSPGDPPHLSFSTMKGGIKEDLEATDVSYKQTIPEISQRPVMEMKDSAAKAFLVLERSVTSNLKPDRLRIPMSTSRDRLTELRLETGLPLDIKTQAIPEVDIEKDPSRETSPIPPDNSFTFALIETGSISFPISPTTPNSSDVINTEAHVAQSDTHSQSDKGLSKPNKFKSEDTQDGLACLPMRDHKDEGDILDSAQVRVIEKPSNKQIQLQEFSQSKMTFPIICIPQVQATKEEDNESIEQSLLLESPLQEGAKEEQKMGHAWLMVDNQVQDDDPKSGADEWSHSGQYSDDEEPATDSSRLSPYSDHSLQREDKGGDEWQNDQVERRKDPTRAEDLVENEEAVYKKEEEMIKHDELKETMFKDDNNGQCMENTSKDESTNNVTSLDENSDWKDSQDNDKSIMTEQIEALPLTQSFAKAPVIHNRNKKSSTRGRGRPEWGVSRREPMCDSSRGEMKKKKVGVRKADYIRCQSSKLVLHLERKAWPNILGRLCFTAPLDAKSQVLNITSPSAWPTSPGRGPLVPNGPF
ncbi:uncharacterized protein LOC114475650 isoform X2 [Gouania willdenowi]|uniref:uncharacterized protein LOC114475650 isoform X2 n=1 Tax=Gouania willdenowi TaxID=441366 RepID=UPI00105512E7|nr:microtubule-associated protein 2 isoform X2 [Gouania willdenowi]